MVTARALYEQMGFVVVSELPRRFGLRYWLFRKDLAWREGGTPADPGAV